MNGGDSGGGKQIIYIARHGCRQDWVDKTWKYTAKNRHDPPLSEVGQAQAKEMAEFLKDSGITHVLASPFTRTAHTAHEVAEALGLPVCIEPGLGEWMSHTIPQRLSPEELKHVFERVDVDYKALIPTTGLENAAALHRRCERLAALIEERHFAAAEQEEKSPVLLLVGHAASVIAICRALLREPDLDCYPGACSLTKVVRYSSEESWTLEQAWDCSHLSTGVEKPWRFPPRSRWAEQDQ
ncbi:C6 zinc cluster transcription factor-like protein [Balamuthia mandrillaris]